MTRQQRAVLGADERRVHVEAEADHGARDLDRLGRRARAEHAVDADAKLRVLREQPSFGMIVLSDFFETSFGIALSMLICMP